MDVLLLADVFEAFRTITLSLYKLDPAFYITSPHLSFDAMLRHTGVNLDLLSDPAMFAMFDSGIRGGVAMISKRYAKANNPQMGDDLDESSAQSTIKGLDANNLYGHAMTSTFRMDSLLGCLLRNLRRSIG